MSKDLITIISEKTGPIRGGIIFFLHRSRDDWYYKQIWADVKRRWQVKAQKINLINHLELGPDLATAQFVIRGCQGRVQDERGVWISRIRDLPPKYIKSFKIISIDINNTNIRTEGTDNFAELEHLRSLNLSRNKHLDDFACDQIARQFRKSKALETIDLSYNKQISVHGLNVLFRIPSLKQIRAINTGATSYQHIDLFTLAAEEERNCQVLVHEGDRQFLFKELEEMNSRKKDPPLLTAGKE